MRTWLFAVALGVLLSSSLCAQVDCSDGTRYDDGFFENGDGLNPANVHRGGWSQLMESASYPARLNAVCLCWVRNGSNATVHFDLGVWSFSGGTIGGLVATVPNLQATGIPALSLGGGSGQFYRYDLSSAGINISGPVLIGPIWRPGSDTNVYECSDQTSAPNKLRLEYLSSSSSDTIGSPTGPVNAVTSTYALGIRSVFGPPSTCVPSDTALCLQGGRFRVEATFQAPGQAAGTAHAIRLTADTGYLWFFQDTNVETVVKVLDACGFNQKYWVFAGGLTNVAVTLTVTDTQNGTVKTYSNPQGTPFKPIQDTSAFATCPTD